jgi:hypothetical protein
MLVEITEYYEYKWWITLRSKGQSTIVINEGSGKTKNSGLKSIAKKRKCKQKDSLCWSKKPYLVLRKVQVIVSCSLQIIVGLDTDHDGHVPMLLIMVAHVTNHGDPRHRSWREHSY